MLRVSVAKAVLMLHVSKKAEGHAELVSASDSAFFVSGFKV